MGQEVENLTALLPETTQVFDRDFDPKTVYLVNSYSIVHLAAHAAFVPGDARESFILFGDGSPASMEEIEDWQLPNIALVVLSACET